MVNVFAAAVAALMTVSAAPVAGESRVVSSEVLVASPVLSLPHFWASTTIPDLDCPSGMHMRLKGYHDGSGLRVPWGVEVRSGGGGWGVDVAILLVVGDVLPDGFRPRGIRAGTATSWASDGARSVQIVLHCVPTG